MERTGLVLSPCFKGCLQFSSVYVLKDQICKAESGKVTKTPDFSLLPEHFHQQTTVPRFPHAAIPSRLWRSQTLCHPLLATTAYKLQRLQLLRPVLLHFGYALHKAMWLNCPTLPTEASCPSSTMHGVPLPDKKDVGLNHSWGRDALVQAVSGPQMLAHCVSSRHYEHSC